MNTQTPENIKKALSQKLKVTKNGFEASLKADTPDEAIELALAVVERYKARTGIETTPVEKPRSDYPALLRQENGTYVLRHGGGEATPWDPAQDLNGDYRVQIDLVQNTKGFGWDVSVKGATVDELFALLEYTETKFAAAFAPAAQ